LGDFAIPVELFSRVALADGLHPYQVMTCGPTRTVKSTACKVRVSHGLSALRTAHTLIVVGTADVNRPLPPDIAAAIRQAAARKCRIASICSGAFVLAATGLLDGRRATTHWKLTAELSRRYPRIQVEPNVLYVDQDELLTSAGATAGMDLCLHLIRKDHGAAVAAESARLAVAPLEREGGQAQFIRHTPPAARGSLQPLQTWIAQNLSNRLSVAVLARRHATSVRTLHRRFVQQTGLTPAQWILRRRLQRAQELLETTSISIDAVAHAVGLPAASTFRERFRALVGTNPVNYRRLYRDKCATPPEPDASVLQKVANAIERPRLTTRRG
jgi:transcriptional regulator GlxA family with amidase domain